MNELLYGILFTAELCMCWEAMTLFRTIASEMAGDGVGKMRGR